MYNHSNSKIIHWVSFNLYQDLENHYRELMSLFEPFNKSELKLKNNQTTWKDAYTLEKDNIEKTQKKVYTNLILQTNIR